MILKNPNLSLYCFDDEAKQAWFVELPEGIDLTTSAFVYMTQYEEAQRIVAVSYDTFYQLAETLPPVEHLIMIYISGRSGSTLLSHIFNEVEEVMCLSEPDVITQFLHLRDQDRSRDVELRKLFDSTVRILFRSTTARKPTTYALKFRMETLRVMDLFHDAIPHAKNLYLYRDCVGFVSSFYRIGLKFDLPLRMPLPGSIQQFRAMFRYDYEPRLSAFGITSHELSMIQHFTIFWLLGIEFYLAQATRRIPLLAIRYRDLRESRVAVLKKIFAYCGLPGKRATQPFKAFDRDSQAGTPAERKDPTEGNQLRLTDEQLQEIHDIVDRHAEISTDMIVLNTFIPEN